MQQQKLVPAYGVTKTEWAATLERYEASRTATPKREKQKSESLLARLKKRFH